MSISKVGFCNPISDQKGVEFYNPHNHIYKLPTGK